MFLFLPHCYQHKFALHRCLGLSRADMTRQYRTMQTELSAKLRRVEEELALNQAQLGEAFCCIFATFRRFYFYDYALSITTTTFS